MARKIIKQKDSFGVLRANPRISGNVKITVDSSDNIWLNSIDSNAEMSNRSYKGFRISPESSFYRDLYTFFNNGQTPPQFVFGLSGEGNPVQNQIENLASQYNFIYSAGVTPLVSDKYSEDFSYLAPFWLGENIPDYFVIFKVNDPIDYPYQVPVTSLQNDKSYKVLESTSILKDEPGYLPYTIEYNGIQYTDGEIFTAGNFINSFTVIQGQGDVILLDPLFNLNNVEDTATHFIDKILPKSTLVATYDMGENSKIGKYLRKIKETPGFTDSLIDARFEDNQITTYNGVNYSVGIFDKKGDYLLDFYSKPSSQIGFEDFITDGFRRNGIISYKLLNLEFLFDDKDSQNYTINRYFGMYVNAEEVASFKLDGNALYLDQGQSGNTPVPTRNDKGYYYNDFPYFQYNNDGVRIFLDPERINGIIPTSYDVNSSPVDNRKFFWIKDKNGDFLSLKRSESYGTSPDLEKYRYGLEGTENQLVLQNVALDLSVLTGQDIDTRRQYGGVSTGEKGRAYQVIRIAGEITNLNPNCFIFYNPLGYYGTPGAKYDIIQASDMSSYIDEWGPGSYYSQDNAYYFHPYGTPEQIIKALTGIFNSFDYNSFEAFQSGDELVIRTRATGSKENNKYYLDFFQDFSTLTRMPESKRGILFINEIDACDINQKQPFVGGSDHSNTRVKILLDDSNKIVVGQTFLDTVKNTATDTFKGFSEYSNKGSSMVVGKYRFVDEYAKGLEGEIVGLKDFETHATIEIEDFTQKVSIGSVNKISAFNTYDVPLGVFSFYGLREIDMDFWESQYGYTPTKEYYKYLDVQQAGETLIVNGKTYFVSDGSIINYDGNNITGPDFFEGVINEQAYELLLTSESAEANVYPTISSRGNITSGITGSNFDTAYYPDLDAFPGFYGIQSLKFINDEIASQTKFDQLNFGKLESEYDYTQDNYNPEFATISRVSPYITKWSYKRGTDVRGNPYSLNSNIAFSPLNFSPSFFRNSQDPQYFTHEWYQLQKPPYSIPEDTLIKDKNYLSSELDETSLTDANPALRDYFLDYFSIEGEDLSVFYPNSDSVENINLTERYSVFDFNSANGFSETLFRGAKVRIKRSFTNFGQEESIKYLTDDRFYDEYKFSCVIVPIKNIEDQIQSPIKIKVIENRTFKSITFVLEVLIDDARVYNFEPDIISPPQQYLDLDYFLLYCLKDKLERFEGPVASPAPWLPSGNIELPAVGDVKLSSAINVSGVANSVGAVSVVNAFTPGDDGIVFIVPNPDYETDLREEINFTYPVNTRPKPLSSTGPGSFYGVIGTTAGGPTGAYTLPFPTGVGENFINFTNLDTDYLFDFGDVGVPGPVDIPSIVSFNLVRKIPIYQRQGGVGYWENILSKISFANISLLVNTESPYIEYKTYVWNETTKTTDVLDNQFVLEFLRPSVFDQQSIVVPVEDDDKPQELSIFNIGYVLQEVPGQSELYRYSGEYIPTFREILGFENVKNDLPHWVIPSSDTFVVKVVEKPSTSPNFRIGSTLCYSIDDVIENKITLVRGYTYDFDLSDPSNLGYQIYFSTSDRGNNFSSDALTQGYSLSGTPGSNGVVTFTVPYDIPDDVYYVAEGDKYMGQKIKVVNSFDYLYTSFGPYKNNFGVAKNVNYYKYATEWIFRININSPYDPAYNLIGETPIDKRNLSIFESSWDPGFYRQYTNPTTYESLPGTKSMLEEKSFFGSKVMQTPDFINSQKQLVYPTSLTDVLNLNYENYPEYEILWEETSTEIRGVLLMDRMLINYFLNDGAKKTFQTFIVPEFGFGTESDINDDFIEYMNLNVIPIFQVENNGGYVKRITVTNTQDLTAVVGNYADYQKLANGYFPSQEIRYTKVNELRYEFRLPKDPSFDYSLAFSIRIAKI